MTVYYVSEIKIIVLLFLVVSPIGTLFFTGS